MSSIMFVGAADGRFWTLWMHQNANEESTGKVVNICEIDSSSHHSIGAVALNIALCLSVRLLVCAIQACDSGTEVQIW